MKKRPIIVCLFCNNQRSYSDEHVIPDSVGGSIVVRSICTPCNNKLGSVSDSEVNRHRHMYDGYIKVKAKISFPQKYHFEKAWIEDEDGQIIKQSGNSLNRRIIYSKMDDGSVVIGDNDLHAIKRLIANEASKRGFSKSVANREFERYQIKLENGFEEFYSDALKIKIVFRSKKGTPKTQMNASTPSRFVSKALVEMAHALDREHAIVDFEAYKNFAIGGIKDSRLTFYEEINKNSEYSTSHLVAFTENQFIVQFFGYAAMGVDVRWKEAPLPVIIVNDIETGKIHLGRERIDNRIELNHELDFRKHTLQKAQVDLSLD